MCLNNSRPSASLTLTPLQETWYRVGMAVDLRRESQHEPCDAGERDRTEIIGVGGEPEPDALEYQEFCAFTHGCRVCQNVPA